MPRQNGCSKAFKGLLETIDSSQDADRTLSYFTRQQVNFLDAKLGFTFIFLNVAILGFIVGFMLIYSEGYKRFEQARGGAVTHVVGDAVAISSGRPGTKYFGVEELIYPGLENGNVFIATRQTVHRQTRGMCMDPDVPCLTNADCTVHGQGTCGEMGLCIEHSWCDVDEDADGKLDKPEIYEMEVDKTQIWVRSFIQFVKMMPEKLFSTDASHVGPNKDNTFTVRQLLLMCEPIPVNYEEVAELGGVFEVAFRWECNVKRDDCKPDIDVRRVDTILDPDNIGFGFKYAEYVDDGHRMQNEVRGLRFFFRTSGVGKKASVSAAITTFTTSIGLLGLAIVISDLLLTKVFSNRKKYNARKFENSPDFSEYIEALEIKKEAAKFGGGTEEAVQAAEDKVVEDEAIWLAKFNEEGA